MRVIGYPTDAALEELARFFATPSERVDYAALLQAGGRGLVGQIPHPLRDARHRDHHPGGRRGNNLSAPTFGPERFETVRGMEYRIVDLG